MNPTHVKARNYRTFRELDLPLPAGAVAILGSNGAGKSSLANVVDLALFGPDGRSWAPYLTQGSDSTELEIELVFEHGGETYRIRRGYSARAGGKTTLDFERQRYVTDAGTEGAPVGTADGWEPLTREDQRQTQAALEELLGMTRETFRASSMLVQGDGAAFTEAKPADRKRVLAKILGLDRYDELQKLVKADRRGLEDGLQRIAGELEAADRELVTEDGGDRIQAGETALSTVGEALSTLGGQEEAAAGELEALALAASAGEALRRRKAEAETLAAQAAATIVPLERRHDAAVEAEAALAILQDELETLTTLDQAADLERRRSEAAGLVEGYRQAIIRREDVARTAALREQERDAMVAQRMSVWEKAQALDAKIAEVEAEELTSCPTCNQTLDADARAATLSSLRAQAQEHYDQAQAIGERVSVLEIPEIPAEPARPVEAEQALADLEGRIQKAHQDALQRATLDGRAQGYRQAVAARPTEEELQVVREAQRQATAAAQAIETPSEDDVDVVKANAIAAKALVDDLAARRRTLETERAKIEAALERLRGLRDRTEAARGERAKSQAELDELLVLEQAYGRDGIPALIIGRAAIPSIEVEACRILAELGTSYRVELRTEKALQSGATADALDVVILTEDGERPYETFSGGERTRINLALRIGLARLLAHRRGAESKILVIDEPEYLDTAGTAALAIVLRGLADAGDFERVYLISHVPELRDSLDAVVAIVRGEDGYSQIGGTA